MTSPFSTPALGFGRFPLPALILLRSAYCVCVCVVGWVVVGGGGFTGRASCFKRKSLVVRLPDVCAFKRLFWKRLCQSYFRTFAALMCPVELLRVNQLTPASPDTFGQRVKAQEGP